VNEEKEKEKKILSPFFHRMDGNYHNGWMKTKKKIVN
jgi:hypothetical protein